MSDESAPSAPDYSGLISALNSNSSAENGIAQAQQQWAQSQYGADRSNTDQAVAGDNAIASSESGLADDINSQYENTYMPLENQFANEAQNYASDANIKSQMGRSEATASQANDQALNNSQQQLEAYGISPDSTRSQALTQQGKVQGAASAAAAGNQAYQNTVNTGLALEQAAIGQGEVMPSMAAGANNTATNASNAGVNSDLATTASGASTMGTGAQYYGLSNGTLGTYGSTLNNEFQNELAQFQANQTASSGLGALAGSLLGGSGSFMKGLGSLGVKVGTGGLMFAAKGGAVPDITEGGSSEHVTNKGIDDGDNDDIRPFVDHHFYVLHAFDDEGKKHEHVKAAVRYFFKTGKHVGTFTSPEAAEEHAQRQDYTKKFAQGGAVDVDGGQEVSPSQSPSRGAVTDDVSAVTDQGAPMRVNVGEFIMPKDVMKWRGEAWAQKEILKARKERMEAVAKPTHGQLPRGAVDE